MNKCPYASGDWKCKLKKGHIGKHQIMHAFMPGIFPANNDPDNDGDNDSTGGPEPESAPAPGPGV